MSPSEFARSFCCRLRFSRSFLSLPPHVSEGQNKSRNTRLLGWIGVGINSRGSVPKALAIFSSVQGFISRIRPCSYLPIMDGAKPDFWAKSSCFKPFIMRRNLILSPRVREGSLSMLTGGYPHSVSIRTPILALKMLNLKESVSQIRVCAAWVSGSVIIF